MKVLLDNCVDRNARSMFPEHEVRTAVEMGWDRLKNGDLITGAAREFEVLVTTDKNIRHQQNLELLPISILELDTPRNRLKDLVALTPYLPAALAATHCARHRQEGRRRSRSSERRGLQGRLGFALSSIQCRVSATVSALMGEP